MPGLNLTTSAPRTEFKPAPADLHLGICVQVIDLGTHTTDFVNPKTGKKITKHEVRLAFELPNAKMENGDPFLVSQKWNASLHEKAKFRPILESWRGAAFTANETAAFDMKNLLGKAAMVNVVHNPKADGSGVWVNITALAKVGRNPETGEPIKVPTPFNLIKFLELTPERFDAEVFLSLAENTQAHIMKSEEWASVKHLVGGNGDEGTQPPANDAPWPDDDDIPF